LKQSPVFDISEGPKTHCPICFSPFVDVTFELMDLCSSGYPDAFSQPFRIANSAESAHKFVRFEEIRLSFGLWVEAEVVLSRGEGKIPRQW
jgi:hypothetical protein